MVFMCFIIFRKRDPGRLTWWGEIESLHDVDRGCGGSNKNRARHVQFDWYSVAYAYPFELKNTYTD